MKDFLLFLAGMSLTFLSVFSIAFGGTRYWFAFGSACAVMTGILYWLFVRELWL